MLHFGCKSPDDRFCIRAALQPYFKRYHHGLAFVGRSIMNRRQRQHTNAARFLRIFGMNSAG
jgi:hypothetical protein